MSLTNQFFIQSLKLNVRLGWPEEERKQLQMVFLDADISFPEPIKACFSDDLKDTVCYADLISNVHQFLETKSFRLLEHLTYELFSFFKTKLPAHTHLTLSVTKYPDLPGLTEGIRFTCDDSDIKK